MIKILANDGIDDAGKNILEQAGFIVDTKKVAQEDLASALQQYHGILVRSATTVRKDLMLACPSLKLIGRAGVGMDNIDVPFAKDRGIKVINTPEASSQSVAELVFAHLFSMSRYLYDANRSMPSVSDKTAFNTLKKQYSKGTELRGKTLGIIGFGMIGRTVARTALGLGMNILPFKLNAADVRIEFDFFKTFTEASLMITMKCVPFDELLHHSDFITLHVPHSKGAPPVLSKTEFDKMKDGVGIINTSRGGVVHELDLIEALNSGKVAFAGLDVFENEPNARPEILQHPKISLSPHIGGSTVEAQKRIGIELAEKVVDYFKTHPL
ncbi:MAG TPA: D-2-hydroxyacid dehydrogenase [Bacteroidia bacterium]|nr:D-2-hydroxyacid dehydrogenase [Bacteroidia bacterium]